jgi:deazaflavin-dependent oxidoreductase (nitroreductase family)
MILVNHRGARTGTVYTAPLVYTRDGDNYIVIASKGGAPDDPQWFRNLVAHPDVTVEVGTETIPVRARVAEGDERTRLFRAQADAMPNFDEYANATTREIPVVVLEPR